MQENNFESIISTWRRKSEVLAETSNVESMPGESHSHLPFKKKEEDSNLLVIERPRGPIATAASAGTVVATVEPSQQDKSESASLDEEREPPKSEKKEEAAGDVAKESKNENYFLENDNVLDKSTETWDKEKGDKVDSVFLKPPQPHKVQPRSANNDEEDCGIKCLYYTLQCCDCVLM